MDGVATHPVLRFLRRLTAGAGDAPDAELLGRFARGDEAAFAALLRRHGPMVFGVCTRVLGNTADAEDAFQATFLVLVRRAAAVGRPGLLANWLYGVARRTALKAKTSAARRRRHEGRAAEAAARATAAPGDDLRPVLDEELERLPARYRLPLVLCYLEGRTHEEAAQALDCPRETVTTRLVRARERLRGRLARRGVSLSVAGLAAVAGPAAATPPAALAEAIARAAAGTVPPPIATLTEGVLNAMLWSRLRSAAALLLGLGLALAGAGLLARHTLSAEPAAEEKGFAAEPAAGPAPAPAPTQAQDRPASVKSMPPVVVKTVPPAGDTQVDAKTTTEIRVTFSKEMADQSWSWTQISKETYPTLTGKPFYDKDKRTCVLPVKLEPGKTYVLWLNPERFKGFRDTDGRPAVFYPLVFETKP